MEEQCNLVCIENDSMCDAGASWGGVAVDDEDMHALKESRLAINDGWKKEAGG